MGISIKRNGNEDKEEWGIGNGFRGIEMKILSSSLYYQLLLSLTLSLLKPCANVVNKAGEFLVSRFNELTLCSAYPGIASYSGLTVTPSKRKEKVWETSCRFPSCEVGHPQPGNTDVSFSANSPVLLYGLGVYMYGGDSDHQYEYDVEILKVQYTVCIESWGSGLSIVHVINPVIKYYDNDIHCNDALNDVVM